jgi:hypothetical protein
MLKIFLKKEKNKNLQYRIDTTRFRFWIRNRKENPDREFWAATRGPRSSLSHSSCVAFARNAVVFPSAQVSSTLTTSNGGKTHPWNIHRKERDSLPCINIQPTRNKLSDRNSSIYDRGWNQRTRVFCSHIQGVCLDGIFRFIMKLGTNQVLDGQTTALTFIHYRDETHEPGFLLPYAGGSLWTEFSDSL